ncbi:MAG: YXWGXW repeat-containing protein [Rhodoferax sp.]
MMKLRKTLLAAICIGSLAGITVPLTANADVGVYFNTAPPAPRYEVVPAPRRGYVWVSGFWDLRGHRHVWHAGHWERARRGYHMEQPTWTQNGDRWELRRGHWNRGDRDGDGVPDRKDRAPNNPYVQ